MISIPLGSKVKCKVTGFIGIAVTRVEHLNGCVQYGVKPKMRKDEKLPDTEFFDIGQLEIVGDGVKIAPKKTGGMSKDLPRAERMKL